MDSLNDKVVTPFDMVEQFISFGTHLTRFSCEFLAKYWFEDGYLHLGNDLMSFYGQYIIANDK